MRKGNKLSSSGILKALLDGYKIKLIKAPKGVNVYLKNDKLVSEKITYLQGIPMTFFNPDVHYEIDHE